MNHSEQFALFWSAYPKRNRKKVGHYPCELWFEAKKPSDEVVKVMLKWLKINADNKAVVKGFYAELPDPIRFLRDRRWEDDISSLGKPKDKFKRFCFCGRESMLSVGNKFFCSREHRIEKLGW